jgi:hypothetical protein
VAGAKLLLLCDLFAKRKCQLSRQERHEIMKQAKAHMPVFLKQLHRFLTVLRQQSQNMTAQQRYDVASYLIPEVCAIHLCSLLHSLVSSFHLFSLILCCCFFCCIIFCLSNNCHCYLKLVFGR